MHKKQLYGPRVVISKLVQPLLPCLRYGVFRKCQKIFCRKKGDWLPKNRDGVTCIKRERNDRGGTQGTFAETTADDTRFQFQWKLVIENVLVKFIDGNTANYFRQNYASSKVV